MIRSLMPVRWIRSNRWCFSDTNIRRHRAHAAQTLGDQTAGESSHGDALGFGRMIERRDEGALKPGRVIFGLRHESTPDHQRRRTHHCPVKGFTIRPGDGRLWHDATMGKALSSQKLKLLPIDYGRKSVQTRLMRRSVELVHQTGAETSLDSTSLISRGFAFSIE